MFEYTIIEDASPYYIRFAHPGIEKIVELCKTIDVEAAFAKNLPPYEWPRSPHQVAIPLSEEMKKELWTLTPLSAMFNFDLSTMLFCSKPGARYVIHKDGGSLNFGLNYNIQMLDKKCETNFYSDDILEEYPMNVMTTGRGHCRLVETPDPVRPKPIKTMIAQAGECVLFNTGILHDWDYRNGENLRLLLALRDRTKSHMNFDDIKKLIFNL